MPGTYIAARVHPFSESLIREFMEQNQIPLVYPNLEKRRHITIFSSDDDFVSDFKPVKISYLAYPKSFDVFPTREGNRCLVMKLSCPDLVRRHHDIARTHGATDRFPEFKCHVSLSYDIGEYDISQLPPFESPIIVGEEYCEPFNANWVRKDE
jgi:hypothetical protein